MCESRMLADLSLLAFPRRRGRSGRLLSEDTYLMSLLTLMTALRLISTHYPLVIGLQKVDFGETLIFSLQQ